MMNQKSINYNKTEIRGIVAFVLLIVLLFILPQFFTFFIPNKKTAISGEDAKQLKALATLVDSTQQHPRTRYNNDEQFNKGSFTDNSTQQFAYDKAIKGELFNFDPNTIGKAEWMRLGVSEKTASTIENYKSKGGKFFQPDDIARIYGLSDAMVERLIPFVRIEKKTYTNNNFEKNIAQQTNGQPATASTPTTYTNKNIKREQQSVDVNYSDTTAWKALPGIGSKLSARIVNYRAKLGGFYSVDQIGETFGLADSVFQKIKPYLAIGSNTVQTININTATYEQLIVHPYINKSLANSIVQYRIQHGNYADENAVKKLALYKEEVWAKLRPYIVYQ